MPEPDALELRRLELEEKREANALLLRQKELEIEAKKASTNTSSQAADHSGRSRIALISVFSAGIGAVASMGAAYLSGNLSVQERQLANAAEASLEQQKFSYELITAALAEEDDRARAQRLQFMVEIGLLRDLKTEKLIEYARLEVERIDKGEARTSYLPVTRVPQKVTLSRAIRPGHAVRLVATGPNRILVIKEIRSVTGMGLKDSKNLSETSGELIITGLGKENAIKIARRFQAHGATVEVEFIDLSSSLK